MDFTPTDDRRMLRDSVSRYLAENYGAEERLKRAYEAPFHAPEKWAELCELGLLHALAPEEAGGFGGSGFDIATVFECLGAEICPEPVLGALLAIRLLHAAGAPLDDLLSGSARYAVAIGEPDAPYSLDHLSAKAEAEGESWALTGHKSMVYGGNDADKFLVAAHADGQLALFELEASAAEIAGFAMIDGGGAAELRLEKAPARLLLADARAALESALDAGRLALCAECVGAMDRAYAMLVDYMKQRKQFGQAIGKFQALQHRAVDLGIEAEQARSITILAADRLDGPEGARFVSMAKNLIGRAGRKMAEETTQMTGGIGVTWEYPGAHYTKRMVMIDHQLGDADWHLQRVMG